MAGAVRLVNGGVIEVRTGVLQGIGPIGPRGLQGLKGPQGDSGPQGDTGPAGAISQYLSYAKIAANISVAANTDQLLSFGNVQYDDTSIFQSTSNFVPADAGDYLIQAWLDISKSSGASTGTRSLWLTSNKTGVGTIARVQLPSSGVAGVDTNLNLSWTYRATAGELLRLFVRSSDTASVSVVDGAVSICRVGSGPVGPPGAQGQQGPVGPTGPQGPVGPQGNASGGFNTYADLT